MNILYIERNLAEKSLVFDQIKRISANSVNYHCLAVIVGSSPVFTHENVTSVHCPFFPKIEQIKSYLFTTSSLKAFAKLQKQKKFDLLHAHFAYPDGYAAYNISKRYNIPFVITLRGSDILLYPESNRFLKRTISKVLQHASGVIGVSQAIIDKAISLGAKPGCCLFQPDGIDETVFKYCPDIARQKNIILAAGSLLPVKNFERLLTAFSLLKLQLNSKLIIAGKGPLDSHLKEQASRLNIASSCSFIGHLTAPDLAKQMQKASVLVLPSISEGWGNVITEAHACGTPVVGANIGGIKEQLKTEDIGLFCDPNSSTDICQQLKLALTKTWDNKKISEYGRRFTRNLTAHNIANFYNSILKST